MKLPDEFWVPNQFGVRGGVEPAFMSTTLNREVAMGYAAGDGARMGIVIEVQQGMINRGADISWLSQYSHEREILFGPLTAIEAQRTRVEGSIAVIESAFSINLNSLTLEQVLSKRRKIVRDAAESTALETRKDMLASATPELADDALESTQVIFERGILAREADWLNNDANLSWAVNVLGRVRAAVLKATTTNKEGTNSLDTQEFCTILCQYPEIAPEHLREIPQWLCEVPIMPRQ
eukprot:7270946-Prymnesium_polylepis.1